MKRGSESSKAYTSNKAHGRKQSGPKKAKLPGAVIELPNPSKLIAQKALIQIHEQLFKQAQQVIQWALLSSNQQICLFESQLTDIENKMNRLSDILVETNNFATTALILGHTDHLSSIYEQLLEIYKRFNIPGEKDAFQHINRLIRNVVQKYSLAGV